MTRAAKIKSKRLIGGFSFNEASAEVAAVLALAARDYKAVGEVANSLIASNWPASACIGQYYAGLACFNNGKGSISQARSHHETALRFAPQNYQQRAALALANLHFHEGDYDRWVRICEMLANGSDPLTVVEARRALAIARSLDGSHKAALARLEDLYPVVISSPSILLNVRLEYLNSLAVELGHVGRVKEALWLAKKINQHPLAARNPEFRQTVREIEARGNVLYMPARKDETETLIQKRVSVASVAVFGAESIVDDLYALVLGAKLAR